MAITKTDENEIRTIPFYKSNYDLISILYEKDEENGVSKTAMYKVVNCMIEFARHEILNSSIDFLQDWEYQAVLNKLKFHNFVELEPNKIWTHIVNFNEELGMKLKDIPEEKLNLLLLKVLYDRKKK